MPIGLKSGSRNLLEPSGLVEACDGIALPLQQFDGNQSISVGKLNPFSSFM
jgi:hypothetical protein